MQHESMHRFAAMLAALSQPTRLRIVEIVAAGGAEGTPAGEIARIVHCPASTLSFHLKELSQAGLLDATPQGRYIRYSVQPAAFASLADFVAGLPGEGPAAAGQTPAKGRGRTRKGRKARDRGAGRTAEGQLSIFSD
jgi:DNA-binding transcriptional ArsR family regulator